MHRMRLKWAALFATDLASSEGDQIAVGAERMSKRFSSSVSKGGQMVTRYFNA